LTPDPFGPTLYDILGIDPDAPQEKVRAVYRLRSREAYPRRPGIGDGRLQRQLNEAYYILRDPKRRAAYNESVGLPRSPRQLRPGKPIYAEIKVPPDFAGGQVSCTLSRWEPCSVCWREGCARCQDKGAIVETVTLLVTVPADADEVLVEGHGAIAEPGGERGDLILYVIRGEQTRLEGT
jgi:DnaJ-class molecular chaperone